MAAVRGGSTVSLSSAASRLSKKRCALDMVSKVRRRALAVAASLSAAALSAKYLEPTEVPGRMLKFDATEAVSEALA